MQIEIADETFTAYQLHKMVNIIREANSENEIRPQMMYNYARNGLINGVKNGSQHFTKNEVMTFLKKYASKRGIEINFDNENENQMTLF